MKKKPLCLFFYKLYFKSNEDKTNDLLFHFYIFFVKYLANKQLFTLKKEKLLMKKVL